MDMIVVAKAFNEIRLHFEEIRKDKSQDPIDTITGNPNDATDLLVSLYNIMYEDKLNQVE